MPLLYEPEWKEFEKDITSEDNKKAAKAAEAFDETRKHITSQSRKAKEWEEDRKKNIARDKPLWRKKEDAKEKDRVNSFLKSLKNLGSFKNNITPAPGYILVVADSEEEVSTATGIILSVGSKREPNTGVVINVSEYEYNKYGNKLECPVKLGDHIVFKLGAGASANVEGIDCRLMRFDDLLGIIDD